MTKQKNRGWVKNVAIIFLTVLLLLTFLSNTIMNRSLPEVAAQYVNSGSVTTRVRGTGTVTANESYEVKLTQTRKIQSVAVRVGDQVSVGDALVYLTGEESDELKIAQSELDNLELNYQKALLAASTSDYAKENRDIQLARDALAEAEEERDGINYSEEAVAEALNALNTAKSNVTLAERSVETAQEAVDTTQIAVDAAQENVNTAQANLDRLGGLDEGSSGDPALRLALNEASTALQTAKNNTQAVKLQYGTDYNRLKEAAEILRKEDNTKTLSAYMQYLSNLYTQCAPKKPGTDAGSGNAGSGNDSSGNDSSGDAGSGDAGSGNAEAEAEKKGKASSLLDAFPNTAKDIKNISVFTDEQKTMAYNMHLAYDAVTEAETKEASAQAAYNSASNAYYNSGTSGNVAEYNKLNNALQAAKNNYNQVNNQLSQEKVALNQMNKQLTQAKNAQEDAQAEYDKISGVKQEVADAKAKVKNCQVALEDLIFALEEQQKADGKVSATNALDLSAQRKAIDQKNNEIAELTRSATGGSVVSEVAGTVAAVGVTAGDTAQPDTALVTIQVDDRGYSLSFSVTTEQSRKLSVGDTADVTNYYWGGDINATITGIRNDPENPQSNKIVSFAVSGDVEPGTSLTLSVGQKSANYDMTVPNSALRSDNNGDFVLIVIAKSTPLGNRYIAQRADVKILASDDTTTAVSGALTSGDFVITTSTAPIEAGMQVRMAET